MKDLTEGSVTKHLLHMASFMAVSMFVSTLYLLADLFWVGRLGKEAIAEVRAKKTGSACDQNTFSHNYN